MSKLIVQLQGGLGNQMFQYATARSISLDNNLDLVIDDWTGFFRDTHYQRKYELNNFQIKGRIAKFHENLPFLYMNICTKLKKKFNLINKLSFGNFIQEKLNLNDHGMRFHNEIQKINLNKNTWVRGFWQSHLYFEKYKSLILHELTPPQPKQNNFKIIGKEMSNTNSIALGLRIYEESFDPTFHAFNRKIKSIFEINKVRSKFKKKYSNYRFFVFSTRRFNFFKELNLPNNTIYVTYDDGYKGTIERMWLLSQCKHHIFNNSSFYWWGAWLSQKNYQSKKQTIYASDNFINQDGYLKKWYKF
jgi:hypothetical protein